MTNIISAVEGRTTSFTLGELILVSFCKISKLASDINIALLCYKGDRDK